MTGAVNLYGFLKNRRITSCSFKICDDDDDDDDAINRYTSLLFKVY
jgi:hypothetical protein